jgi:molybdopterin-guanine dinucleotide biosynthesis protein MobB
MALASEFVRQGRRVGIIRHSDHPADMGTRDSDTWRHFNEGAAGSVLFSSPGFRALFEKTDDGAGDAAALVKRYFPDRDIVLVDGLADPRVPRIEVHRRKVQVTPMFSPSAGDASRWIALVTDDESVRVPFPTFRFTDTAWLVTIGHLAWDRAMLVEG